MAPNPTGTSKADVRVREIDGVAQSELLRVRVSDASDLEVGKMRRIVVADREILLCRTKEGYFAVDDICSHAYARLDEGRLRGHRTFCPLHSAAFDVLDRRAFGPWIRG